MDLAKDGSAKGRSWCHAEKGGVTQPRGGGWWEKVWIPPVFWFVNPFLQKSVLLKKMWNRKIWYQSETFRWWGPNIWPSYHLSHGKLYKMAFPSFPLCRSCTHIKSHWRWLASTLELYFQQFCCLLKDLHQLIQLESIMWNYSIWFRVSSSECLVVLAHYNKLTDGMLRVASKKQHANIIKYTVYVYVVWQILALIWHFSWPVVNSRFNWFKKEQQPHPEAACFKLPPPVHRPKMRETWIIWVDVFKTLLYKLQRKLHGV